MELTILHQTTYRYPGKIHEIYSIVRLHPRIDATQYCTKYELNVAPRARIFSYAGSPSPVTKTQLAGDPNVRWLYDELHESRYVVFGPELRAFAAETGDPGTDDRVAWYLHAGTSIKQKFTYNVKASASRSDATIAT